MVFSGGILQSLLVQVSPRRSALPELFHSFVLDRSSAVHLLEQSTPRAYRAPEVSGHVRRRLQRDKLSAVDISPGRLGAGRSRRANVGDKYEPGMATVRSVSSLTAGSGDRPD